MTALVLDATDLQLLAQLQSDAALSNQALAEAAHTSAPTCLRRVKLLQEAELIERTIAVVNPQAAARITGHGLTALVEITLDHQNIEALEAFENRVLPDDAVQQCYRVSPGPDFVLVVHVEDMPAYLALAQRLFTSDANVRNVKSFFSVHRAKFAPRVLLGALN